ncbi:thioredoxin-like protein, partial [Glonium stellatum]
MAKPKVTLFVDIVSPFSYLAFYALQNFPIFKQCEVTYVPILLGGLMKACGNTPPLQIKNKDKWVNVERARWSRLFNIPISAHPPDGFPISTLPVR